MQQDNTDKSVHIPTLMTSVNAVEYSFVSKEGVIFMPEGCCVHMTGAIEYFERIDSLVKSIIIIAGENFDTCYRLHEDTGEWVCHTHQSVQRLRPPLKKWLLSRISGEKGDSTSSECGSHPDAGCICQGNWRAIVAETAPLLDKKFRDSKGKEYIFYGVIHGSNDYYYGMFPLGEGKRVLLSCVGSIEGHGFTLIDSQENARG